MNQAEARDQLRSVAKEKRARSRSVTLDEAKARFREATVTLDRKLGLEELHYGPWGTLLFSFFTLFSTTKVRALVLPLISSLVHLGGKAKESLSHLVRRQKGSPRAKRATSKSVSNRGLQKALKKDVSD